MQMPKWFCRVKTPRTSLTSRWLLHICTVNVGEERVREKGTESFVCFISKKHYELLYYVRKLHTFLHWDLCNDFNHHRKIIGNKITMFYLYYLLKELTKQNLSVLPCLSDSILILSILKLGKSNGEKSFFAFLLVLRVQFFLINNIGNLHKYQENSPTMFLY